MTIRGFLKVLIIWAGVCLSGFYVWNICVARIIVDDKPTKSLEYFPSYSEAYLTQNRQFIQKISTEAEVEKVRKYSHLALQRAPLSEEPFLHVGLADSLLIGRFIHKDLFLEVKRRNVRSKAGLRSLIALAIAENDVASIVANLDLLMRLGGKNTRPYYDAIETILRTEQGRDIINFYLQSRPNWAPDILIAQINGMGIDDIANVSKSLSFFSKSEANILEDKYLHERILEEMINLEAYEQAYEYWGSINSSKETTPNDFVYNNHFKTNASFAPFNWKLSTGTKFFAEFEPGGGLFASYAGSRPIELVSQVVLLSAGSTYQLKIAGEWNYRQRQGMLSWRLMCLPDKDIIAVINLGDENRSSVEDHIEFQVPNANCDAQYLQLIGRTGQYSERIHAIINFVNIVKLEQ